MRKVKTATEVILDNCIPEPNTGCWLWTGYVNNRGYGQANFKNKFYPAHRLSLKAFDDIDLPSGSAVLQVDHMCRERSCVNPRHLRIVNPITNVLSKASKCIAKINKTKTHCKFGHAFTPTNTYRRENWGESGRQCKACTDRRRRERIERLRH